MHCSVWPDDLGWALRRLAVTDLRDHAPELPDFYIAVVHPSTSVCECCKVIRRLEFITRFDMPLCVEDIRPIPCHPAHQLEIKPRPLPLIARTVRRKRSFTGVNVIAFFTAGWALHVFSHFRLGLLLLDRLLLHRPSDV